MVDRDLDAVIEVEAIAYEFPWSVGIFEDCLRAGYLAWVAENRQGQLVGHALMSMVADEAHVLNVCVHPQEQRGGLGRALMRQLMSTAQGAGVQRMLLEVRPSNQPAIALYDRLGFREIGRRKGYYPDAGHREDALVLAVDFD